MVYNVISYVHVYSCRGTISHVHGYAPKTVLHAQNLMYEKL